eukprot:Tbor_TRINITY_DN3254_c0_g1::TRINITY_DN3254_c0_g1_i1::g.23799::m.23799
MPPKRSHTPKKSTAAAVTKKTTVAKKGRPSNHQPSTDKMDDSDEEKYKKEKKDIKQNTPQAKQKSTKKSNRSSCTCFLWLFISIVTISGGLFMFHNKSHIYLKDIFRPNHGNDVVCGCIPMTSIQQGTMYPLVRQVALPSSSQLPVRGFHKGLSTAAQFEAYGKELQSTFPCLFSSYSIIDNTAIHGVEGLYKAVKERTAALTDESPCGLWLIGSIDRWDSAAQNGLKELFEDGSISTRRIMSEDSAGMKRLALVIRSEVTANGLSQVIPARVAHMMIDV